MDSHIALQAIDEPTIKDFDLETGEETFENDVSDLQNFLKAWVNADMNPDKLNVDEDNLETKQRESYKNAVQHFANALEEFRYMTIILENVISKSHLGREYAETTVRELSNPDVPLGSDIIDKQLQLQSSSKFFLQSSEELGKEISKFQNYFQKLDELSHKFPIGFYFDYVRVPLRAAVIPSDPLYYDIPWIVLQPDENGDILWRLSYEMRFLINQKNVFFDCEVPYLRLTSQVMLQYLFQYMRFEMITLNIDYSINMTSNKISYTAQNSFNFEMESSAETKKKKQSDVCPAYLPSLVSKSLGLNPQPFKYFKEIIDERALIKNAVDIVLARFLGSDFCDVKYAQKKRAVMIQITPIFGLVSTEIKKPKNQKSKNTAPIPNDSPYHNVQPYNITCYLAKNHFRATDPQSLYSYVSIDLRSRGANNALNKWCESHYFRMFQLSVAALASRFGFDVKMNDHKIRVKCESTRKIKIYTTGRGDYDVVVSYDDFVWKTKWNNVKVYGTLNKIEYLFFFNFLNK